MLLSSTCATSSSRDLSYTKHSLEVSYAHSIGFQRGRPLPISLMSLRPRTCILSCQCHLNKWAPMTLEAGSSAFLSRHQHKSRRLPCAWYAFFTSRPKVAAAGSFWRLILPSVYMRSSNCKLLVMVTRERSLSTFSSKRLEDLAAKQNAVGNLTS